MSHWTGVTTQAVLDAGTSAGVTRSSTDDDASRAMFPGPEVEVEDDAVPRDESGAFPVRRP